MMGLLCWEGYGMGMVVLKGLRRVEVGLEYGWTSGGLCWGCCAGRVG